RRGSGDRPGHRADRGHEALQRDQVGPCRTRRPGRAGERHPGQGEAAAHRGGTAVNAPLPQQRRPHVTGWGRYVPSQVLTNHDLERMVDTNDEWIVARTGIRERRVAAAHETTASMAAVAS